MNLRKVIKATLNKDFAMKTYIGSIKCPFCNKDFNWKYIDDGYRSWMKGKIVTVTSHIEDKNISLCTLKIDSKTNQYYFNARCTHCHAVVSFQCSEDIKKELSS